MKLLLLAGLIFVLVACGVPEVSTSAPTPEAIHVIYPSVLKPWADKMAGCALENPLVALYFSQSPNRETDIISEKVVLMFGESSQGNASAYLSQVGKEQIVVIVNQENDLSQLSMTQLHSIFTGQVTRWENNTGSLIQVWVLPNGEAEQSVFNRLVISPGKLTTSAMLAPDPEAMLEAISGDINGIGFLPESFLTTDKSALSGKVKIIQLATSLEEALNQPVIAMTKSEPQGFMRNLLACLQSSSPK